MLLNKFMAMIATRTEYVLDVRTIDTDRFLRQIDSFNSQNGAKNYANSNPLTNKNEKYSVVCIQYDDEGNEIDAYAV